MKSILQGSLLSAAIFLMSAMSLFAQDVGLRTLGLQSAVIMLLVGKTAEAAYADLDQDGQDEALITYADDCNVAGCLFSIVDEVEDGIFAEVAFQFGTAPKIVSDGTVIDANGVFFQWTGLTLIPYFDLYNTLQFYDGRAADRALILETAPWMTYLKSYDIKIANVDLYGDDAPERFIWLEGLQYAMPHQSIPYYVVNTDGSILTSGTFIDRPFLFNLTDRKAAALITNSGYGFHTTILE